MDGFDFHIIYRPRAKNNNPDALSRRAEHRPEKGGHEYQPVEHVLKPGQWVPGNYDQIVLLSVQFQGLRPVVKMSKWLVEEIISKSKSDSIWQVLYDKAAEDGAPEGHITALVTYKDGMLFHKGKVGILSDASLRKLIMESEHDSRVAGHMGMDKTMELVNRNVYWPEMAKDIEDNVRICEDCQKNKASRHKRHGALHPLELFYAPWDAISIHFITQLPKSDGCSTVWVIVDRFTKMAHFVPVKDGEKTAEGCAMLFLENIWKLHGLPSRIISDRDPVFTSTFWAELMGRLDVRLRNSTAFHPQTDSQTERGNRSLEQYLWQYCNYEQDNWNDLLALAEYAYNNSATTATQMSPFFANFDFHPRTNWPMEKESKNPASRNYAHWMESVHELCVKRLEETRPHMGK